MAFQNAEHPSDFDYTYLAADTKPTTSVQRGARALEVDTGKKYVFGSDSAWYQYGGPGSSSGFVGRDLTPAHTAPSATNSTSAMLASNVNRKAALLQNIGSVDVYIKLGAVAVASQGILLQANGGSFSMSDAIGNLDQAAINGITASGSATVLVTEWV